MKPDNNNRHYIALWVLLAVSLAVVVAVSLFYEGETGPMGLKKAAFHETLLTQNDLGIELPKDSTALNDSISLLPEKIVAEPDTTVKSILIFGDSMTILIAARLAAYGKQNGYEVNSVTWDSSSTVAWSGSDNLDNYIKQFHPDFIMISLGSNELFLANFDSRVPYIDKIREKIGNIPFVWIGPPNWKKDKGFNAMMLKTLPEGTYFVTEGMELDRGPDHIHPTRSAGALWTDSIMRWIKHSAHPIRAEVPHDSVGKPSHNSIYIKAHK